MTWTIFKAVLFEILKCVTQLDYKKRRKTYIHQRKRSRLLLPTVEDKKETHAPGTVSHFQTMNSFPAFLEIQKMGTDSKFVHKCSCAARYFSCAFINII